MIDINKKYKWVGLDVHIYEIFEDKVFFRSKCNGGEWIGDSMRISVAIDQFKEVSKYDDLKIDDPVIVWDDDIDNVKEKRYFSGVDQFGNATVFDFGATSWSSSTRSSWDNCIKAEDYNDENI